MTRAAAIVASGVVLAAMGACTTVGIGRGDLSGGTANAGGRGPVTFGWKSADGANSGDMDAMLADGRRFTGRFVQLTRERFVQLDPLLVGWPDGMDSLASQLVAEGASRISTLAPTALFRTLLTLKSR